MRKLIRNSIQKLRANPDQADQIAADVADAFASLAQPSGATLDYLRSVEAEITPEIEPDLSAQLSVTKIAAMFDLSERTIYKLVESGRLRHSRVGMGRGRIKIRPSDVRQFLDRSAERSEDFLLG